MPVNSAMTIAKDVQIGEFTLNASQILSIGKYEKLEVTVDLFKQVVEVIRNDPLFAIFQAFERQDNFILCKQSRKDLDSDTCSSGSFVESQTRLQIGDMRIGFEVVRCPQVTVLCQQIQHDDVFTFRPFDPEHPLEAPV